MALKKYKPTNPASRDRTVATFDELTASSPHKPLTVGKKKIGGRGNSGRMTVRFRGGGHKRRYRVGDYRREKHGVPAKVATVAYDPNRSARIALLNSADGEKRSILWPHGRGVGPEVLSGATAPMNPGDGWPRPTPTVGTMATNTQTQISTGHRIA